MDEKKYKLTNETITFLGKVLRRIEALKDFADVKKGDKGGFIESEENLSQKDNCWIYDNAIVYENTKIYENVENVIKEGLESLDDVELAETSELGRINKVDHLEISDLRVRGMWLIKTPFQHFDYLTEDITDYTFKLVALIPDDKYFSFNDIEQFEEFCEEHGGCISDEEIEDPQNPANFISSKLITYYY